MVDKLRVVHPTPGMLVLRRVDDALFIHHCDGCPGYSLLRSRRFTVEKYVAPGTRARR
jgi:hypothetical protein